MTMSSPFSESSMIQFLKSRRWYLSSTFPRPHVLLTYSDNVARLLACSPAMGRTRLNLYSWYVLDMCYGGNNGYRVEVHLTNRSSMFSQVFDRKSIVERLRLGAVHGVGKKAYVDFEETHGMVVRRAKRQSEGAIAYIRDNFHVDWASP